MTLSSHQPTQIKQSSSGHLSPHHEWLDSLAINNDSGVLDVGYYHAKHTLSLNAIAALLGLLGYEWDYVEKGALIVSTTDH